MEESIEVKQSSCCFVRCRGGLASQPQQEFPVRDIIDSLKLTYTDKYYTSLSFFYRLQKKIDETNALMREDRIQLLEKECSQRIKEDIIFKFVVEVFGKQWVVHKGYSDFKVLHNEVPLV